MNRSTALKVFDEWSINFGCDRVLLERSKAYRTPTDEAFEYVVMPTVMGIEVDELERWCAFARRLIDLYAIKVQLFSQDGDLCLYCHSDEVEGP